MKGFTLIEMMVVVAIIGILSAMGGNAISGVVIHARSQGAAEAVARMMNDARLLAATQGCAHVVQVNGVTYAPPVSIAGAPATRGTVSLIRKQSCGYTFGATLPNYYFEPGDTVLQTQTLGDGAISGNGIYIGIDAAVSGVTIGSLGGQSLAFGYGRNLDRHLALDTGSGTFAGVPSGDYVASIGLAGAPVYRLSFRHRATDIAYPVTTLQNTGSARVTQVP